MNFPIPSPRKAQHNDDTEGVEAISPGLPDSERATLGKNPNQQITFARSAASEASIALARTHLDLNRQPSISLSVAKKLWPTIRNVETPTDPTAHLTAML